MLAVTIKQQYTDQQAEMGKVSRGYRGLLLKLKNMCSEDSRIIRDIENMHEQMRVQHTKMARFDSEIRDLFQKLIKTKSECEEKIERNNEEKNSYQRKMAVRRNGIKEAERKRERLSNEQREEEETLADLERQHERQNSEIEKAKIGLGILAVVFPVPALVAIGVLSAIETSIKASQEKLDSIRSNISMNGQRIKDLREEIKNDQRWVEYYSGQIDEANDEMEEANMTIGHCQDLQKTLNIWIGHLGVCIDFLIRMIPEAQRIHGNIGLNERALQKSVDAFKTKFNDQIFAQLKTSATVLAIESDLSVSSPRSSEDGEPDDVMTNGEDGEYVELWDRVYWRDRNLIDSATAAAGRRIIKSLPHRTYLRAYKDEWKVDMAREAKEWEHWYVEDHRGFVVIKAIHSPGRYLKLFVDGRIALTDSPHVWSVITHQDGSFSFGSNCGWLSAKASGSVVIGNDWREEVETRFLLETW